MPQKQYYISTRPSLTSLLSDAGYKCEPTVNVFHPERMAWRFQLSQPLAYIVAEYYKNIGKPVPVTISKYLSEVAPTTSAATDSTNQ